MRRKIVGSSWKMHITSFDEGSTLSRGIAKRVGQRKDIDIFFLPSFPLIQCVESCFTDTTIKYGAQNVSVAEKGAYTGEVPINLLKELGCTYIELGHAERRTTYNETNEVVNQKARLCERYDIVPIICIGESTQDLDYKIGHTQLRTQIIWALDGVSDEFKKKVILAYEPVWAIGKEKSADKAYIEKTHAFIRQCVREVYGVATANQIRIIYGGSVSPQTASELANSEDIDGLFVGRFGLQAENFEKIIDNFVKGGK